MRRQYFTWSWLVLAIVLTGYGAFNLAYNAIKGKELSVLGLTFFIIGLVLLVSYIILFLIDYHQKKKAKLLKEECSKTIETPKEEPAKVETEPIKSNQSVHIENKVTKSDVAYEPIRKSYSSCDDYGGSGYVKKIGYGPILRVSNNEILDMRSNTYYRIEGRMVKMLGSGPVYEIYNNRIKLAFGGYLYEISGNNVNKTYGGYYASISGSYLQLFDLSEKYEIPSDLSLRQKLAIVAILFGTY